VILFLIVKVTGSVFGVIFIGVTCNSAAYLVFHSKNNRCFSYFQLLM